ncbi:MAG: polysaccharide deacetylase family protein [Pseudomonadota bacterium]|nr:polysaccharide deacetylase family protein [Pseudomonadota bacterium]|tara:strand:- start:922 stop:1641 length:720 start_codon:yes stop_codon:yes gene_type:complete
MIKNIIKDIVAFFYYNSFKRFSNHIGNRTLIYHAFGMKLSHDTYGMSIPIDKFREHMIFIKENFEVEPLSTSFSSNFTISITIDDGYKDTMYAADILNKLNIPFTLFITSDNIGEKDYLSAKDIRELSDLSVSEIGSHGKTHAKLGNLSTEKQNIEVQSSKYVLEKIIKQPIESISLPHGSYDDNTFNIIKSNGYKRIATSIKGLNTSKNESIIKRSEIIKNDNINHLIKKVKGYYDYY